MEYYAGYPIVQPAGPTGPFNPTEGTPPEPPTEIDALTAERAATVALRERPQRRRETEKRHRTLEVAPGRASYSLEAKTPFLRIRFA